MVDAGRTSGVRPRPLRVLVVEDDDDARDLLELLFSKEGFECRSAHSGRGAMHILATFVPDLIVSDVSMPEEDGCSLMRRIRSLRDNRATIPAIAVSALGGHHHRLAALECGFDLYFAKPAHPMTLIEAATRLATSQATRAAS